jgi:pyruvate kinase
VLIDDGAIEGVVRTVESARLVIEIVRPARAKLRAEKGINVPDSPLSIRAFTDEDREILRCVAQLADMVALSYVTDAQDVVRLQRALDHLGATDVCLVMKIELAAAFHNLPNLLLEALKHPPSAVMVARGDLAVEVGFERLAELQEEILWLAEAAHTPVIWATQVLESAAKLGMPSRAEITDAAWSGRAECVMLNKGPHIVETVRLLDDILTRMQGHQHKRTPTLRQLAVAGEAGSFRAPGESKEPS